ncbi:Anaphase-promoting complex subunit [Trichinella spiralis]|uniref:Cell division cycle protein 27 homolog n=1 Tax=Trichinella spiralis TaxID=6334 RepID=A0ABR3KUR9_TRISP
MQWHVVKCFLQAEDRYRLMHCYALVLFEQGYFPKAKVILDESLPDLKKLETLPNVGITESLESMSVTDARADDELRIAKCLMKIGSFNDAIVLLERLTPRYRSGRIIVRLAECYYKTNEIGKAIKIYKEILSEFPYALYTLVRLLNLVATRFEICWERGGLTIGLMRNWKLLKGNPLILRQLARVSRECGLMLEAVSYYEECFSVDPYDPEDADRYISLLLSLSKTSEAEAVLDHLVTHFRESVQTYAALAYCSKFWSSRKLAFGYAKMAQGLSSDPHVDGYLINGILMSERGSTETAVSLLRKTLDMDRTRFEAYEALVNMFLKNGNLNEAESTLHNCMNALGGTAPVLALCAKVLLNNNHEQQAICTLADYYIKNYDYELAEAKLTTAMSVYPSHPELIRIMRTVKWKLGKISEYRNYSKMIEETGPVSDKLSFIKCDELLGLFAAEDSKGIGGKENFSKNDSFENASSSTRDDQSSELARFWSEMSRLSKIIAASTKVD